MLIIKVKLRHLTYLSYFLSIAFTSCWKLNNGNQKLINMDSYKESIENKGLPYRTETLLTRERQTFHSMVNSLFTSMKSETEPQKLTYDILEQALNSKDNWKAYNAAFIAGRCSFIDEELNTKIIDQLEKLSSENILPDVAIEVAMSLILKNKIKRGKHLLEQLVNLPAPLTNQYKAAFYLAQMGDLSGFTTFIKTLDSDIPHYRLLAMRHLVVFHPFEGKVIDNTVVNIQNLCLNLLNDPDELLRSEIPFYLDELNLPNLEHILKTVIKTDSSSLVKNAAQIVLEKQIVKTDDNQ